VGPPCRLEDAGIDMLHLYVVVVMMFPTQSYTIDDAFLVSFDVINGWLMHYC
jgi:hypothetical protein